ncbi:MAG: hypothetical protein FWC09_08200, partial [Lachnospiraceae bacterium]|nr:hypothetical protein [Lachnospiraceae bacterium]
MGLISNIANIWLSSWKSVPVDLGGATQVVTQSGGAGSRMFSLINSAVSSGSTGAVMLTMTVTTLLSSATLAYDIVVDNDSPLQVQETVFDSGVITDEEGNYLPEVFIDENGNIILADASASEAFSMMDLSRAVNDPDFDFSYFADRFDITSGLLADSDDLIDDTELSEDELLLLFNEEDEEDEGEEILLLDEEAETAEEEVALADNLVAANNVADDTANVELPVPAVIPSPEPVAEPVYIPAPAPAPTPAPTPAPIVKSNQQGFAIANPGTLTYGDANLQLLTTGGNGNGAVTFERISGTSLNVTQSGLISIESFGDTVIKTTKAGDSNYNAASASLTISVNKRNVTITPDSGQGKVRHEIEPPLTFTANPALVGNDTFQGALNRASGETVGNYGITLGSLDAGNNYNLTLGSNVNFTITLATPNYTLPTDLTATYGESLSDITLPLGWAWNAPGDLVGNAGERAHKAAFTPVDTDNYSIITVDLTVTVAKANQASISIDNPASLTYGDADVQLTTTGGSGTGAVSFERVSGTSLNVSSSGILTVQSAGDTVIEVTKAGDNNYNIASNILTISVNKLAVAITPDSGQAKVRHEADPPLTFTANPALIGSDAFQGALSRTLGETVGAYDITLGNLSAGNNYNLTLTGNTQFTITSAIPNYTLPTGLEAAYGALLSGITLPSGWTWNKPSDLVGNLGEQIHEATFTPTDTVNYTTVTLDLDVTVTKAVPTVANIPTASQMNTGNMLSSSTLSGGTVNGITG